MLQTRRYGTVHYTTQEVKKASTSRYLQCAAGGALASTVRWILNPLEVIKGLQQTCPRYNKLSFVTGLSTLYKEQGWRGWMRGLGPTAMAYATQTSTKYALYEYFKDSLRLPPHVLYIAAAGCAELCAAVAMCPWEQLRVQVQTRATFQSSRDALVAMWQQPSAFRFPFGTLPTLWGRQIPSTMVNFYIFENVAQALRNLHGDNADTSSTTTQLGITLLSGYIAGMACAIVSHPADSLLSLQSQAQFQNRSLWEIARSVGPYSLATRGLAPRMLLLGTIIGGQWWIYESFKILIRSTTVDNSF